MKFDAQDGPDAAARIGAGALAGAAATFVMDAITDLFYTAHIKKIEAGVSGRGAAAGASMVMLTALRLEPTEKDAEKAGLVLHWTIGVAGGVLAGLLAGKRTSALTAAAISAAGMLAFDEFGLERIGATPPSSTYPWQTNFRSVVGHGVYGLALAAAYSYAASLANW